jgi:Winged helix-turn helix
MGRPPDDVGVHWCCEPAYQWDAAVGGRAGGGRPGATQGTPRVGVRHRAVDPGADRRGDPAAHRGALPPRALWRLLRRLGWSPQRPARRARERDEAEIARWRTQDWPRIKGALRRGAWLCFLDESGCSLRPPVRRTWAPKGRPHSCGTGATGNGRPWPGSAATGPTGHAPGFASTASPTASTT